MPRHAPTNIWKLFTSNGCHKNWSWRNWMVYYIKIPFLSMSK